MKKSFCLFLLLSAVLVSGCLSNFISAQSYSVKKLSNNNGIAYNFMYGEQHFMTLINENGTLNFRPHPGVDKNGWGSSWYIQPFLSDGILSHTVIESIKIESDCISVLASGKVSQDKDLTYGQWNLIISFRYAQAVKEITGNGKYSILLKNKLNQTTGNLNLYKIASNYLVEVPLLNGQIGDTGDMTEAVVKGKNYKINWNPKSQPSFFTMDKPTSELSINVTGAYNNVNTAAQGFQAIAPAYKPSLEVDLISKNPKVQIIFAGIFDLPQKKIFYFDNVGLTPLILNSSPITKFNFDIRFKSKALPEDGS
jgi:hypothetical protein